MKEINDIIKKVQNLGKKIADKNNTNEINLNDIVNKIINNIFQTITVHNSLFLSKKNANFA